jgi:DNA-binding transcriptional ArsR family regulator
MVYDPVYYKMYYARNREKILSKRREKYHTDEEYRRKCIEYAKRYNRLHYQPRPRIVPENWEKEIDGIKLYSTGRLCKIAEIKYPTLRSWLSKKVIPVSFFKINLKYYYTEGMIEAVKEVKANYEQKKWYEEILKRWKQDKEVQKLRKLLTKRKKCDIL